MRLFFVRQKRTISGPFLLSCTHIPYSLKYPLTIRYSTVPIACTQCYHRERERDKQENVGNRSQVGVSTSLLEHLDKRDSWVRKLVFINDF